MASAEVSARPVAPGLWLDPMERKEWQDMFIEESVVWLKAAGTKLLEEKYEELVGDVKGDKEAGGADDMAGNPSGGGAGPNDTKTTGSDASPGDKVSSDGV